jgi:DNA-binding response OmpR family regulator
MGNGTTVAVIDDNRDYRQLYKLWLPEEYDVVEAADGLEALQRIDDAVDAVVLDRQMPKLDGAAVASKLQDRSVTPGLVMISSAKPDVDILDIPVDTYLRKPADQETLLSALSTVQDRCEYDTERRDLLALADRRATVADAVRATTLAESGAYQRTVERLEKHGMAFADAVTGP